MQTSTSQHRGRTALPATLEAARDDLAWGQDPIGFDFGAAVAYFMAPNLPGTDYTPGYLASDQARLDCLEFTIAQYSGGSDV